MTLVSDFMKFTRNVDRMLIKGDFLINLIYLKRKN